ncbi:MAG: hypothetical protein ACYCYA_04970 [Actinomycetes bacterium]
MRTPVKAQVHAAMAKRGILPTLSDMFTPAGQLWPEHTVRTTAKEWPAAELHGLLSRFFGQW